MDAPRLGSCGCVIKKVFVQVPSLNRGEKVLLEYLRKRQAFRPSPEGATSIIALETRLPPTRSESAPKPEAVPPSFSHLRESAPEGTEESESELSSLTETEPSLTSTARNEKTMEEFNDVVVNDYLEILKTQPDLDFGDFYSEEMEFYAENHDQLERAHKRLSRSQIYSARYFMKQVDEAPLDSIPMGANATIIQRAKTEPTRESVRQVRENFLLAITR